MYTVHKLSTSKRIWGSLHCKEKQQLHSSSTNTAQVLSALKLSRVKHLSVSSTIFFDFVRMILLFSALPDLWSSLHWQLQTPPPPSSATKPMPSNSLADALCLLGLYKSLLLHCWFSHYHPGSSRHHMVQTLDLPFSFLMFFLPFATCFPLPSGWFFNCDSAHSFTLSS